MKLFKKTMTTIMATVLLIQSVLPVSLFAGTIWATADTSFDTRLATIGISERYNSLVKSWSPSSWEAITLAAKLYAISMVGPSCEQQASATNTSRLLSSQTKALAPAAYKSLAEEPIVDAKAEAINQATTSISSLCYEVFAQKDAAPSDELLKIYDKFFATFFPGLDFEDFVQGTSGSEDPNAYIQDVVTAQQIQKVYDYLNTKQLPNTQSCKLTNTDETLYIQAKTQYIAATDAGDAAVAKMAFDTMNQIQSRVVCSTGVEATTTSPTLNPDCTNKVSILKSQIASLQSDPISYQQDIARIQKSIDTITQSADCSIKTKRTQLPIVSWIGITPRLSTDVLQFQSAVPTQIPDTTPLFCQSTASALGEQLDTASYFTINKLIDTIDAIKWDLTPQKQSLATLVQTLAVDKAAIKAQNLWLVNSSNAMRKFVSILEMIANNVLSNAAMYKVVDVFPLINGYSTAINQTTLWMADTFASLQRILDAWVRYVWDENNKLFKEEPSSNPWITFLARSNEASQTNDLSVVIKELSAFQFKEWVQEVPYSEVVTPSAPTLQDITIRYFGSQNGETTPYDNTRNNRVWYEVSPSSTTTISDENYTALSTSRMYYSYIAAWSFPIEIMDINGMHIAIVPDHNQRVVRYLDPGIYKNSWLTIEVGANGEAAVLHENENTYPRAIDVAWSINGKLEAAIKWNITWPEDLAPFIQATTASWISTQGISTRGLSLSAEDTVKSSSEVVVRNSKQRQDMLPEKVVGEIFFSPNVLKFELNRTYNPTNGTNTITLQAMLIWGMTCWVAINGSVTYFSDEYGIPEGNENPVINAQFDIGTDSYKFNIESSNIDDIVQQIQNGLTDIPSLLNEKITNSLSVLGTQFGTLFVTQDGINVVYPNGQEENLMDIVFPVIERLDLGRLGQFIDFASDGGSKDATPLDPTPIDPVDPNQEQAYVDTYYNDQNMFNITFIGDSGYLVNPTISPTLYVDACFDKCTTYTYTMDLGANNDYSYTVPLEVYEQATAIYVQAEHNGYPIYHQFM